MELSLSRVLNRYGHSTEHTHTKAVGLAFPVTLAYSSLGLFPPGINGSVIMMTVN